MLSKRRAVFSQANDFPADADDLLFAGCEVMAESAVVLLAIGSGHQHADVEADDLDGLVPEQPLGRWIERLNPPVFVDDDDAVDRRFRNGTEPLLALSKGRVEIVRHVARNLNRKSPESQMLSYLLAFRTRRAEFTIKPGNFSVMAKKSPRPTVLVVDDEALIRWSLVEALGERGYEVAEAGDARSALAAIEKASEPYDVILLDYRLPDSGDLRLLATVKRLAPTSQVIMISAHNSPELAQGASALGAYSVISKPFEVESLSALVAKARAAGSDGPGRA